MELCFEQRLLFLMPRSLSITIVRWNYEYSKHTKIRRHNIYTPRSNECPKKQTFLSRERFAWFRSQHFRLFRGRPKSLQVSRVQSEQMQSPGSQSIVCVPMESQPQTLQLKSGYLNRNRSRMVQPRWNNTPSRDSPKNTTSTTSTEQRRNRQGDYQRGTNPNAQQRLVTDRQVPVHSRTQYRTDSRNTTVNCIDGSQFETSPTSSRHGSVQSQSMTQASEITNQASTDRLHGMEGCTIKGVRMLDEELVQLLQHGQREAFTTLVSKWQDRIYTFCYRQLGETTLAEEATQDVFVKVYTSIHNFRKEAKFSTWLYRIATNHCINLNNRHHRRQRNQHQSFDEMHNQPAEQNTPLQQLERKDFEQQLQQALHLLPEEHRILLILRDIQDCSYEEIAEITQLNVGTIKSRIHRGRNNLRQILTGAKSHE